MIGNTITDDGSMWIKFGEMKVNNMNKPW
jgi:hypothetical protein